MYFFYGKLFLINCKSRTLSAFLYLPSSCALKQLCLGDFIPVHVEDNEGRECIIRDSCCSFNGVFVFAMPM